MEVKFNLNDYVKVKLNDNGRQILKEEFEETNKLVNGFLGEYKPKKEDENGYVKFQLWDLINTFGDRIYLAGEPPFETEIKLEG